MGRKQARLGKHVLRSLVLLMLLSTTGCALWGGRQEAEKTPSSVVPGEADANKRVPSVGVKQAIPKGHGADRAECDTARPHLAKGKKLLLDGNWTGALQEYREVTSMCPDGPESEEALLSIGMIWAHPANPRRNYAISALYLKKLASRDTKSIFVEQAKVLAYILRENNQSGEKIKRLRAMVDGLERVDIEIEGIRKVQDREEVRNGSGKNPDSRR